ncbi:metal-dependent phosphohydrolase [Streptomyces sp. PT12]|nr:metal-dependent phosphohydrolase [Streptomyces sp. PT12]
MGRMDKNAALLDRFAALPEAPGTGVGEALLRCWSEPHRRYHTRAHLAAVLDRLDELTAAGEGGRVRPVALAAWCHDAVYDPRAPDNEERSARLAEALLDADPDRDEVARLVRLTADHAPADGDANGAALCDADLAVLAGPPEAYAAYAAEVRQEYGFVPDADFRAGRAEVLRQLLVAPRLFRTDYGAGRWESTARFNVRSELRLLTG